MRYRSGPQLGETVMEVSGVVVEHLDAQTRGDDLVLGRRAQEYRLLIATVKSARAKASANPVSMAGHSATELSCASETKK